jgi:hypothetical protein
MHTKDEILVELQNVQQRVVQIIAGMDVAQFSKPNAENWSPADHIKHLLMSIKPFAKAMMMPREQMTGMFGTASRPPMSFDELVKLYNDRIKDGLRAENTPSVTPESYRFAENTPDVQTYLIEQWNSANERLSAVVKDWTEADLDQYQLPHPAIGMMTLREMLFFTVYHNRIHGQQIEEAVTPQQAGS